MEVPHVKVVPTSPAAPSKLSPTRSVPPGDRFLPSPETGLDPNRDLIPRMPGMRAVQAGTGPAAPLTSMEFKMLLQPSRFEDAAEGVRAFRALVDRVVGADPTAQAAKTDQDGKAPSTRFVAYLDTPDGALNRKGYILRERRSDEIAADSVLRQKDVELTLKFRSTDRALAASKDVSAAKGLKGQTKFEMDVTPEDKALRHLYSKSTRASVALAVGGRLGDVARLFPPLADLGLPPETPLAVVNGRRVRETAYPAGTLELAPGVEAKAGVALWQPQGKAGAPPVIAEFSFSLTVDEEADPAEARKAQATAERLLASLRQEAAAWASGGGTKTEYIYGHGSGSPGD